jgi:periplasmic divalent cation tolerance protein
MHVILSSCPPDVAQKLADALVEQRVAACVTILPGATSTYRWQGAVQHDTEALLLIKVPLERTTDCIAALRQLHPYDVPEIIVLAAKDVAASYLAWARAACEVTAPTA